VGERDVLTRAARPPDRVLRYGDGEYQVADLRLPGAAGLEVGPGSVSAAGWPLVIFFHGGFWRSEFDRAHTSPLAEGLAASGFAVCTPEFRRTGYSGGGWPETFRDVAAAVDVLPGLVAEATGGAADSGRVVLAGHSAGGHLALWAAGQQRHLVARRDPAPGAEDGWIGSGERATARTVGVVSLAGVCDLAACYRLGLDGDAAAALMGGGPDEFPEQYRQAEPMGLVPTGVALRLVHGGDDERVPWELSRAYARRAAEAADDVRCEVVPGYGHFAVLDPLSGLWPEVVAAFRSAAAGPGAEGRVRGAGEG
jgi:acetyl esterase/lipase